MGDKHTPGPPNPDIAAPRIKTDAVGWLRSSAHFVRQGYPGNDAGRLKFASGLEEVADVYGELVEALKQLVVGHEYTTPAGTTNCQFCDHNMDHEGTYEDMHAPDCLIRCVRAVLAKVEASDA